MPKFLKSNVYDHRTNFFKFKEAKHNDTKVKLNYWIETQIEEIEFQF